MKQCLEQHLFYLSVIYEYNRISHILEGLVETAGVGLGFFFFRPFSVKTERGQRVMVLLEQTHKNLPTPNTKLQSVIPREVRTEKHTKQRQHSLKFKWVQGQAMHRRALQEGRLKYSTICNKLVGQQRCCRKGIIQNL